MWSLDEIKKRRNNTGKQRENVRFASSCRILLFQGCNRFIYFSPISIFVEDNSSNVRSPKHNGIVRTHEKSYSGRAFTEQINYRTTMKTPAQTYLIKWYNLEGSFLFIFLFSKPFLCMLCACSHNWHYFIYTSPAAVFHFIHTSWENLPRRRNYFLKTAPFNSQYAFGGWEKSIQWRCTQFYFTSIRMN